MTDRITCSLSRLRRLVRSLRCRAMMAGSEALDWKARFYRVCRVDVIPDPPGPARTVRVSLVMDPLAIDPKKKAESIKLIADILFANWQNEVERRSF